MKSGVNGVVGGEDIATGREAANEIFCWIKAQCGEGCIGQLGEHHVRAVVEVERVNVISVEQWASGSGVPETLQLGAGPR
jgi:hypothetical protein